MPPSGPPSRAGRPSRVRPARCAHRLGEPARDQRGLLDQRAAQWRLGRQNRLCASTNRVDDRHRWHPAAGSARGRQLAVPDHREMPSAGAVGAGGDHFGRRRPAPAAVGRARARRWRWRRGPAAGPRSRSGRARQGRRCAPAPRRVRGCRRPRSARRRRRGRAAYSVGVTSRGAGTRRQFAFGAGTCSAARPSRVVHVRTPVNRASSAAVSTASARDAERARWRVSLSWVPARPKTAETPRPSATTHHQRCGNFDRRLYGGACAASRRSSRTPASRSCAHSTWSTPVASDAISFMRVRGSAPLKYWPTRRRRSTAVPTYSTSADGPRNR